MICLIIQMANSQVKRPSEIQTKAMPKGFYSNTLIYCIDALRQEKKGRAKWATSYKRFRKSGKLNL
jgi:hypothetical protein